MSDEIQTVDDVIEKIRVTRERWFEELVFVVALVAAVATELFLEPTLLLTIGKYVAIFVSGFAAGAVLLLYGIVEDLDAVEGRDTMSDDLEAESPFGETPDEDVACADCGSYSELVGPVDLDGNVSDVGDFVCRNCRDRRDENLVADGGSA